MSIKVLLIDDEPGVLKALSLLLKVIKVECEPVEDPRTALLKLTTEGVRYDAILSDLRMPHLDGLQLLAELNKNNIKTPFILISGHATDEDMGRAKGLGAFACMKKPFSVEEIQSVLSLVKPCTEK